MSIYKFILSLFKFKNQKKNKQEIMLKEREARLKLAQEIAQLGSWEWDYKRNRIYFTEELNRIFGINKDSFNENFKDSIHQFIHPEDKNRIMKIWEKKDETQGIPQTELRIIREDKEERWIRTQGKLIYDENKNKEKLIGTVQDITQWKETEIKLQENVAFFQMLIDTIPNPIFYKDAKGIYRHCNNAYLDYVGLNREDVINHGVYEVFPKDLADTYHQSDKELMKKEETQVYEHKFKYKDGSYRDVIFYKASFKNHQNVAKGLVGVVVDITDRKKSEKRINRLLKIKEAMVQISYSVMEINNIETLFNLIVEKAVESIEDADIGTILVLDENKNLKIAAQKGYEDKEVEKFRISLKRSFVWRETNGNLDKTVIVNDIDKMENVTLLKTKEGFTIKSVMSAPIIIEGALYGFVNMDSKHNHVFDEEDLEIMEYMRNQIEIAINKHKLYEETIHLSRYDELTKVYNRRYFEEMLSTHIDKAKKYKETFSLVVFDLDGLKGVNDAYGHLAGDELIKVFIKTLRRSIRGSDVIARYGGDEFIGIFLETDSDILSKKFEHLIVDLEKNPIQLEKNSVVCSFSYGVANFPKDGIQYKELMKIADKRMYKNKEKKK